MIPRARGFDMNVVYWNRTRLDPDEEASLGVTYATLDEVLRQSDFVSIHVALNDETRHLIGAEQLALMKSSASIINTARGPIIDKRALVEALQSGVIACAGLDVFENEPLLDKPVTGELGNVISPTEPSPSIPIRRLK